MLEHPVGLISFIFGRDMTVDKVLRSQCHEQFFNHLTLFFCHALRINEPGLGVPYVPHRIAKRKPMTRWVSRSEIKRKIERKNTCRAFRIRLCKKQGNLKNINRIIIRLGKDWGKQQNREENQDKEFPLHKRSFSNLNPKIRLLGIRAKTFKQNSRKELLSSFREIVFD